MTKETSRRNFFKIGAGACAVLFVPKFIGCSSSGAGAVDGGSPFGPDVDGGSLSKVYAIVGDELSELYEMARQATQKLGITGTSMTGANIFIKPNLVTMGLDAMGAVYNPAAGECTKPEIVCGVAEQCLEAGAAHVTIGEGAQGTTWDWSTVRFLDGNAIESATNFKSAVDRLKSKYGDTRIDLLCLQEANEWVNIPSSSTHEFAANGLVVAKSFAEADHVISCPCLKTHQWANLTAAMKNYVGVTSAVQMGNGISRCKLHTAYAHVACHGVAEAGITGAYVDIHNWRMEQGKEDFAIVDCSIGVEGNGPHTQPITEGITIDIKQRNAAQKYFLLASNDLAATDAIAAQLIGFDLSEVKQFTMLGNLGYDSINRATLDGASLEELAIKNWIKPTLQSEDYFETIC